MIARDLFGEDRVLVARSLPEALQVAVDSAERDGDLGAGVLATGSVTMAAEVRTLLGADARAVRTPAGPAVDPR